MVVTMNNLKLVDIKTSSDMNSISVTLIPVSGPEFNSDRRLEELRRLVTDFILLGKKRGRPAIFGNGASNAA